MKLWVLLFTIVFSSLSNADVNSQFSDLEKRVSDIESKVVVLESCDLKFRNAGGGGRSCPIGAFVDQVTLFSSSNTLMVRCGYYELVCQTPSGNLRKRQITQ